ncbi:MAG: flagellar biosynthesis protein FlgD [Clostridiaceae bacterium]|nr:flagellar biosynthesis protein FlgD [Clostridiaceae bacterium]
MGRQKTIEEIIASQAESKASTRNTGELGKDDFLKLLITQVQHQDPLNPTTDTEFIAQLAQFSSLEQMQNLNRAFSYSAGISLIGKYISAEVEDGTGKVKFVDGRVDTVRIIKGEVYAVVGEDDVPLNKITWVGSENLNIGEDVTGYSGIIGMLGKAHIVNDEGKTSSLEGIITTVVKESGGVYAILDEVDIKPYNLDLAGLENVEDYIAAMAGKEISLRIEDDLTGEKFKVEGILRGGYYDEDGEIRLVLDKVKVPAGNIYSTTKIDLISTEHMLLNEILKELRKLNGSGDTPGDTSDEPDPSDETEPTDES